MANYDVGGESYGFNIPNGEFASIGEFISVDNRTGAGWFPLIPTKLSYADPNIPGNFRWYKDHEMVETVYDGTTPTVYAKKFYELATIDDNISIGFVVREYHERDGSITIGILAGTFGYSESIITDDNPYGLYRYLSYVGPAYDSLNGYNYFMILNKTYPQSGRYFPYELVYRVYMTTKDVNYKQVSYEEIISAEPTIPIADSTVYFASSSALKYVNPDGTTRDLDEDDLSKDGTPSGTGGGFGAGGGSGSLASDPINIPSLPSIGAVGTGMLKLYNPTLGQVQALTRYLWSSDLLDNLAKIWTDPLELIISLGIVPVKPTGSGSSVVSLGSITTGITMTECNQYLQFDCGSIKCDEFYGSALDYNPYTKVSIFIPFVGIQPLNTDDVMGSTLRVVYNIDLLTGSFACAVSVSRQNLNSVLYHYSGNMMMPVPVTSANFMGAYQSAVSTVGAIASFASGNVGGGVQGLANAVLGQKESVTRSGSITGASGMMDNMTPYLIIERPIQSLANNYKHYNGYPSNITYNLGSLRGFTKIEKVVENNINAPKEELNEIMRLLQEGVYL